MKYNIFTVFEYFFHKDDYETTISAGEAFFAIVQELTCSQNEIALQLKYSDYLLVRRNLSIICIFETRSIIIVYSCRCIGGLWSSWSCQIFGF